MLRYFLFALATLALLTPTRAAADPPPVEAYGKLPAFENASLSPSGKRYAFITVVGEARQLMVLDSDNHVLFRANVGQAKVRNVRWVGEDHLLIYITKTVNIGVEFPNFPANELLAVLSVNISTQKILPIFAGHSDVTPVVFGEFGTANLNGHWYGYFGGLTFAGSVPPASQGEFLGNDFARNAPDLYRVDLDSGELHLLVKGERDIENWLVNHAGEVVARSTYNDQSGNWQVIAGSVGGKILLSGHDSYDGVDSLSLGRTPDTVLIRHPSEKGEIYE
jgi:hypothetical protein